MGKGDKRTKRGKIWRGSHGNTRPKKKKLYKQKAQKGKEDLSQAEGSPAPEE